MTIREVNQLGNDEDIRFISRLESNIMKRNHFTINYTAIQIIVLSIQLYLQNHNYFLFHRIEVAFI